MKTAITLRVNGDAYDVVVPPQRTLLEVLRDKLLLTGSKQGCDKGDCGCCTVLIDGEAVLSCLTLAVEAQERDITTIEGLADGDVLHPLQEAFIRAWATQCGFCTPGMIMSGVALLEKNPTPSLDDVRRALGSNLCRCTGYVKIFDAVILAAQMQRERAAAQP
ncbi:MAG: (2Fe-2S)-binding protein [Candidatus Tectomicrobia bacterium]|nr:(2Fe-2S)-binding protein [Candidatus Tectomicrobia bacterium]